MKNYIDLLERYTQGKTTLEEEQKLLSWLRNQENSPELEKYFLQKWETTSDEQTMELQLRMYDAICNKLEPEVQEQKNLGRKLNYKLMFRWVVAACILLLAVFGGRYYTISEFQSRSKQTILVEKGQRAHTILPDGTHVWLNANSQLSYVPSAYGWNERRVELQGEAYFEVQKNPGKRFIVNVENVSVEALGTSFNVRGYKDDEEVVTTLVEGKVRTSSLEESMILTPDEQSVYNKVTGHFGKTTGEVVHDALSWRVNRLIFEGETLDNIAKILNRTYGVEVYFSTDRIKQYSFSGVVRDNGLDNILELLKLTAPIVYTIKGDSIILSEKKTEY